jgi:outer membrane protein assembly factor BamB
VPGDTGSYGRIFALDAADGDVLWQVASDRRGKSIPTVGPDYVYASYTCTGTRALDRETGARAWITGRGGNSNDNVCWEASMTALHGSDLYMRDGVNPPVARIDATTGSSLDLHAATTIPALGAGVRLFLNDGTLRAEDLSTGEQLWSFESASPLTTAPLIIGGRAVIASANGTVHWLGLRSGEELAASSAAAPLTADAGEYSGALNAAGGALAVPNQKGITVFAYGPIVSDASPPQALTAPAAGAAPTESTTYQAGPSHEGFVNTDVDPPFAELWQRDLGDIKSYPLVVGNSIITSDLTDGQLHLRRFSAVDGNELWDKELGPERPYEYFIDPIAYDDDRVFVGHSLRLKAFSLGDGSQLWDIDGELSAEGPLVATGGVVYQPTSDGLDVYDQANGSRLWGAPNSMADTSAPTVVDGQVTTSGDCDVARAYGTETHALIWRRSPWCSGGGTGRTAPVSGGVMYHRPELAQSLLLDAATGTLLDAMYTRRTPAFADGLRVGGTRSWLFAENVDRGTMAWEVPLGAEAATPPLIVDDHVWIALTTGVIRVFDLHTGTPIWSDDLGSPIGTLYGRQPVAGLAAGDGVVVVAGDSRVTVYGEAAPGDPDPIDPDPVDPDPVDPDPVDPDPVEPDPVVPSDPTVPEDPAQPPSSPPPTDPWPPTGSDLAGSNPDTEIVRGPAEKTAKRTARFTLTSDHDASFECRLDRGEWQPCDNALVVKRLTPGRHKLQARAVDNETSLADPTPASWRWKVSGRR